MTWKALENMFFTRDSQNVVQGPMEGGSPHISVQPEKQTNEGNILRHLL